MSEGAELINCRLRLCNLLLTSFSFFFLLSFFLTISFFFFLYFSLSISSFFSPFLSQRLKPLLVSYTSISSGYKYNRGRTRTMCLNGTVKYQVCTKVPSLYQGWTSMANVCYNGSCFYFSHTIGTGQLKDTH